MVKIPSVMNASLDPMVFQIYQSAGIMFVSLVVLLHMVARGVPVQLTWWGTMAAAIIYTAQAFAYNGVRGLGNAVGPATWAGIGMVTSFTWGAGLFHENVASVSGCVGSLVVLMLGIFGVALSPTDIPQQIASMLTGNRKFVTDARAKAFEEKEQRTPLLSEPLISVSVNDDGSAAPAPKQAAPVVISRQQGLACALVVGLVDGSLMVPYKAFSSTAPAGSLETENIYIASMGAGLLIIAPVFSVIYILVVCRGKLPPLKFKEGCVAGFATGLFWGVANLGSVQATKFLGMSLGFPLTQTWYGLHCRCTIDALSMH
jgi:hypothetical protein